MESYKLILPQHLNHYGFLFGGNLLQWADEHAYIAARRDYPGCSFVTVGMDRVAFKKGVKLGDVLRFEAIRARAGKTSVEYRVSVYRADDKAAEPETLFSTGISYVRVDSEGRKQDLPR